MKHARRSWLFAVWFAVLIVMAGLTFLPPQVQAPVITQDTDTDFAGGLMNAVEIVGTGAPAVIQLVHNNAVWTQQSPATPPSARQYSASAYDPVNNEIVLFGGYDGAWRGDTWRYNITNDVWTDVTPGTSPPGRWFHGLAYASAQQVMVLYGGYNAGGGLNDTWEFNVNTDTWTKIIAFPNPYVLGGAPLSYDELAGRVILAETNVTTNAWETWAYNAGTNVWQRRTPLANVSPVRSNHKLAFLASQGKTVLYGGQDATPTRYDDTWEFDYANNIWSQTGAAAFGISPDPTTFGRQDYGMTARITDNSIVIFGGANGSAYLFDTWMYSYNSGIASWDRIIPSIDPPARSTHSLAYSVTDQAVVLFSGKNAGGNLPDTWILTNGYQTYGSYRSNRIDSGSTFTDWQNVFWNNTPGAQPAGTALKFKIFMTNVSNPGSFNFVGPDCTSGTYYTVPGSAICSTEFGRYAWYFAELTTTDTSVTPVFDNIGLVYITPPSPPLLVDTNPMHLTFGLPTDLHVFANFSEPMLTASVTIEASPTITFNYPYTWSGGDSMVEAIPTALLPEGTAFQIWINGTDLDGNPISPIGSAPNPFLFSTAATPPNIVSTSPAHLQQGVLNTVAIVLTFSEAMNIGTVVFEITPPVVNTTVWSGGNSVLTISHAAPFATCTWYTVHVVGQDLSGQPLLDSPPGAGVSNPFQFRSDCPEPYVVSTVPFDGQVDVSVTADFVVEFSEAMTTGSVTITGVPSLSGVVHTWNGPTNTIDTISHAPLLACTPYTLTVNGNDAGGMAMLAPYSWDFITACGGPIIMTASPHDGDTGIFLAQSVFFNFSASMNTFSFAVSVTSTVPPDPTFNTVWTAFDMNVELRLTTFYDTCEDVTVDITAATDTSGNPFFDPLNLEPFTFSTTCPNPRVILTDPVDAQGGVPLTYPINVTFDKPMRTLTTTIETSPPTVFDPLVWFNGNTVALGTHAADFINCTLYTVWVNGTDQFFFPLIPGPVPNPFVFQSVCGNPTILTTAPVDGATNVAVTTPIVVDFSEAMNTATTVQTSPPSTLGLVWTNLDMRVTATPSPPLLQCRDYTVWVNGTDTTGNPLVPGTVPNPWVFSTVCTLSAPPALTITRAGGNVDLSWGPVANALSYNVYHATNRFAAFPGGWTVVNVPGTSTSFAHAGDGLRHFYVVRAVNGVSQGPNSTMGVKVALSFAPNAGNTDVHWFSLPYLSPYTKASDIAAALTSANVDVIGKWNPAKQRTVAYTFARGKWRGTDFTITPGDGLYVNVLQPFSWVITGTDPPHLFSFTLNAPPKANRNWIGLPYTSSYQTASQVVAAIEPGMLNTKISEIGRWDPVTQSIIDRYFYSGGWTGTDFTINPGDGLYLIITSSFTWTPGLLTPYVP